MKKTFTVLLSLAIVTAGFSQMPQKTVAKKSPALFRQNMGQWEDEILFQCLRSNHNVYFMRNGLSFGQVKSVGNQQNIDFSPEGMEKLKAGKLPMMRTVSQMNPPKERPTGPPPCPLQLNFLVWNVEFMQSNPETYIQPEGRHDSKVNYFTGEFADHPLLNVPEYESLTYHNLYKGIDLKYYESNGSLKYDFIVAPNASSSDIRMNFTGIEKLNVNQNGELEIATSWGIEKHGTPVSWQTDSDGERHFVTVQYNLIDDHTLGFTIAGQYDPTLELVIDPMHIDWSTYFYGNQTQNWNWTWISDVHIDKDDHVYITGITMDRFPRKNGIYDTSFSGGYDGFICKMLPNGSDIDFFCYIGGSQYEWPFAMTGTDEGETYITGYTASNDYPISNNAYQKNKGGGYPSFVTGLTKDGSALIYSTYVGGASGSYYYYSQAIDVNKNGEVYIGISSSSDPISTYTKLNFICGKFDAFIIKFNNTGSAVLASFKFGGTEDDDVNAIYVDPNGNVYICGSTKSADLIPYGINTNPNIFGYLLNGQTDGYFIKIDSVFSKVKLAKYVGGAGNDMITSIYGDEKGEIYMTGLAQSSVFNNASGPNNPANKFPVNYSHPGGDAVFVARMRKDGVKLKWLTFLGNGVPIYWQWPTYYNWWNGRIRVSANIKEEPIVVGQTGDGNFPVTGDAFQTQLKGNVGGYWSRDAFITKLNYDGTIQFSSFYGGSSWEFFSGIKVRKIGCVSHVVIAGFTYSDDFPTTTGAWRESIKKNQFTFYSGGVVKIRDTLKVYPIDFGPDEVQCNGVLKILDGNNIGAKYRWSTGDTIQTLKITKPGKYWVTSTYGCDVKGDTVTITLKWSPKVPALPKDSIYCHALNLTLDAKNDTIADIRYKWNTGDTTRTINVTKQGQYSVILSTKDCGIRYDTLNIKELHKPIVEMGRDSIFCNNVNINLKLSDPNNEVKYLWNDNDTFPQRTIKMLGGYSVVGTNYCGSTKDSVYYDLNFAPFIDLGPDSVFCDNVSHTLQSTIVSIDKYTKYKWSNGDTTKTSDINKEGKYWMRSENTCGISSDTIMIGVLLSPSINLGNDTTYCDNINVVLDGKNTANSPQYTWGPVLSSNQTYAVTKPGKYYVQVKNKCNTTSDTINFKLLKTPSAYLGNDTNLCVTVSLPLDAGNNGNEATYLWNDGSTAKVFQAIQPGTYSVKVNNYCGVANDTITVKVYVIPNTKLGNDTVYCAFFPGRTLNAGNNNNLCKYTWSTGESTQSITASSPGIYKVLVENICGQSEDSIRFDVSQNPVVKLAKDTNYCDFFNYDLDAGAGTDYTYYWTPTKAKTQKIVASEFGTHTVVVTNKYGCTGTGSVTISNNCYSEVFVPNAFSPNADLINDIFIPSYVGVSKIRLVIWNRWGQKVFETDQLTEGWDGKFLDDNSPEGIYSWQLTYYTGFKRQNREGTFTLVR